MKEKRLKILNECLIAIQDAHDTLDEVRDEEEEAYDNLPEGLQYSERGDMMQEAIDNLDEIVSSLDDVITSLEDVVSTADDPAVMEVETWQQIKVGTIITHKSFGEGVVVKIEGNYFFVQFRGKEAKFILPDAIDKGYIKTLK